MVTNNDFLKALNAARKAENTLNAKLGVLALLASEILGYEVVADLCSEANIEFRRVEKDGVADFDNIRIEDVLSKIK